MALTEPPTSKISPCTAQTAEDIATYYRNAKIGDVAVVRDTKGYLLRYSLTEIDGTNPARGRVYVKQFGAFYAKHGKNCYRPTGQVMLAVPSAEIIEWAQAHPNGEVGYRTFLEYKPFG